MKFQPTAVPSDVPGLRWWIADALRQVADTLAEPEFVRLHLSPRNAEPERVSDGDLVYANGVDWNPGSGAGFYGRESGSWVKL